ncbi:MAG: TA system VapC family ribonuclease toxin [Nitrospirales bacterium]
MSDSIDVNILLYASDRTSPRHRAAREFLARRTADPDPFYLTWPVLMAYLRIATHPRIFRNPLSPDEALGNIEALLACPQVRVLAEDEGFLQVYREATGHLKVRGNLVSDAHVAALLRQHDVRRLYTLDADFRKFPFLETRDPFA